MAKRKNIVASSTCSAASNAPIEETVQKLNAYSKMADGLSDLNTMRGGTTGFKGFVGEQLQAAEANANGQVTSVINNNGLADLVRVGKNGHKYYEQIKIGYGKSGIDYAQYKGMTIKIDANNPAFKEMQAAARKEGVKLVEGNVTNNEATAIGKAMQAEGKVAEKVIGKKKSVAVPTVVQGAKSMSALHQAGMKAGKSGALAGAGFSLGSNLVEVVSGDKDVGDAAVDVVKDTAVAGVVGYGVGVGATAIGSTAAGGAVLGVAGTAGSAIAGTAVGGAVVGAGAAVATAGTAATAATVGTIGTVGSAVVGTATAATAGTAIGGAVAAGGAAVTAGAAAIGAAAVAAAPVLAVGVAIGGGYTLLKKLFK